MFDFNKTLALVKGGLFQPEATWKVYHAENRPWLDTATILTLPMIVGSMLLAGIMTWLFSSFYMFPVYAGFGEWLMMLIWALIGFALVTAVFTFFAGVFKGKRDFNRGVAAMSLAFIPTYVGNVLGTLPWLGWLLSLGLFILSLVFLYRIIPLYLEVPDDQRVIHFVVSIIATIIIAAILGMVLGVNMMARGIGDVADFSGDMTRGSGFLGEMTRQGEIMEAAMSDTYDPPGDGELSDKQVETYIRVMEKAGAMRAEYAKKMEKMAKEMEDKENASLADIGKLYSGLSGAMGANNAAMEIVKGSGGNWAEHVWVADQLRTAKYQQDINDAVKHNYALYQRYEEKLDEIGMF